MQIRREQGQRTNLSKAELKDIFKNKIKLIKKKSDLLKNALVNVQKRKKLFEKD